MLIVRIPCEKLGHVETYGHRHIGFSELLECHSFTNTLKYEKLSTCAVSVNTCSPVLGAVRREKLKVFFSDRPVLFKFSVDVKFLRCIVFVLHKSYSRVHQSVQR